jgi:dephospho-CoA kinase
MPSLQEQQWRDIIDAATKFADEKLKDNVNKSTADTSWAVYRDHYLLFAAKGLLQTIQLVESNPKVESPFSLNELYVLLYLCKKNIFGYSGNLVSFLVIQAVVDSQEEAELYIAKAELTHQQNKEREIQKPTPMIGIVGHISSGKGTVGEILQKRFKSAHFPLSDRLREMSFSFGGSATFPREFLRDINDLIKPTFGMDAFVKLTIPIAQRTARNRKLSLVTLDGFRSLEEARSFQKQDGILIGIEADQKTRYERLVARNRPGDDDWEKFLVSDAKESAWIDPIFAICNYRIPNEGSPEQLEETLLAIMSKQFPDLV